MASWMLSPGPVRSCSLLCHVKTPLTMLLRSPSAQVGTSQRVSPPTYPHSNTNTEPCTPPPPIPPAATVPLNKMSSMSNGMRIYPSFNWTREWNHSGVLRWLEEPTCTPTARLLNRQICHLRLTLHNLPFLRHKHRVHQGARQPVAGRCVKIGVGTVLGLKQETKCQRAVEICTGVPGGRQILAADGQVNSLWVNQLLMHADRPRLWQHLAASLPSISTHTCVNKCRPFIWN